MLMIESSKNKRQNYPGKCFWTQEKETRVKFNPGLSADRPSNNWAQIAKCDQFSGFLLKVKTLLLLWFTLRKYNVIAGQNARSQITSDRRYKPVADSW